MSEESDRDVAYATFEDVVERAARAKRTRVRWRRVAGPALLATCVALVTCAVVTMATKLDAWGFATAGSAFVLLVIAVTDAVVTMRHLRVLLAEESARVVRRSVREGTVEL